jgi:hypothetical protein
MSAFRVMAICTMGQRLSPSRTLKQQPCSSSHRRAISACADCATLPAQKRTEVEAYKDKMQSKIYEMTDQGACAIQ